MRLIPALFGERHSLRRHLIRNIVLALLFSIALASVILIREFYEHLRENQQAAMLHEATEIAARIDSQSPTYGLHVQSPRFRGNTGAYRYTVFDSRREPLAGAETSPEILAMLGTLVPDEPRVIDLPDDRVGVMLAIRSGGRDWYILVSARSAAAGGDQLSTLGGELDEAIQWAILGVIAILSAAILATRRSLRPLERISRQANDIGPTATDGRLSTDRIPAEIMPLVGAVNGAFERLEKGYRAQRDFSSNVAHEVRTPLAVLRSSIERIADPTLRADLKQDVQRLEQMFEQLIDLSRAEALGPASFKPVDLHGLAVGLAGDMAADALRAGRSLAVTGASQAMASGHPGLLSIALGNLVRNALAYSPPGSEIEIEVLADPAGWKVLDRGPGVPGAERPHLFERFTRGVADPQQASGSGIGLAIVKSVADAHGAQVRIADRPGGGSVFAFVFSG